MPEGVDETGVWTTTGEEPDTTGSGATTGGASTTADPTMGPDDTTGSSVELCDVIDAPEASFELEHQGAPLPSDDGVVNLTCGGQGSFMFYFPVDIYGVDTMGEDYVTFAVTMDVDGFNDVGENGHFIDRQMTVYVGCDDFDGGGGGLNVVLPDAITDEMVLHGAPYTLDVTMMPGQSDERMLSSNGTLSVVDEGGWGWCQGCGEFGDECPEDTTGDSGDSGDSGSSGDSGTSGTTGG